MGMFVPFTGIKKEAWVRALRSGLGLIHSGKHSVQFGQDDFFHPAGDRPSVHVDDHARVDQTHVPHDAARGDLLILAAQFGHAEELGKLLRREVVKLRI